MTPPVGPAEWDKLSLSAPPEYTPFFQLPGGPGRIVAPPRPTIELLQPAVPLVAVDAGVPLQLPQVGRTEVERMAVALGERVGSLHDASVGHAMGDREDVADLVGHQLERAPLRGRQTGERADADAPFQVPLAEHVG